MAPTQYLAIFKVFFWMNPLSLEIRSRQRIEKRHVCAIFISKKLLVIAKIREFSFFSEFSLEPAKLIMLS